ncbi:zinc finger CCCH domain-containing protein 18-like isoform X6 [Macrobrachium rosenbergii]|uniref:zinc finger CCCH domain-containing protein 18-like isoform X6 n=1 Tax=Macrobrachium rosenbergii TaxID=79674 RepID=UPI0034D40B1A
MSSMDESEPQSSNQEWDEPMSPPPHDPGSNDGPASPDPMSPDNDGFDDHSRGYDDCMSANNPRTPDDPMSPDDFGGEEPMSPDNNSRNYNNQPGTPDYPMSPENGVCSEGSTRSEEPGQLRGPSTPEGPASPVNPRSPDDFANFDGPRSPDDIGSQDGPRSPDYPSSAGGPRSPSYVASVDGPRSPDAITSPDGPRSLDDFESQDGPRSPPYGPASPDGPQSPDELGGFDGPRPYSYPDGPLSPENAVSREPPRSPDDFGSVGGPRSPEDPVSLQDSASIDGSRTLDGQSSLGGPRTPEYPASPVDSLTPEGVINSREPPVLEDPSNRRGPMTPDDPASSTGFTESQSMRSPAPSNPRSPAGSGEQIKNDQDDRLSEISEGDSALNGELGNEDEQKDEQEAEGATKSKRRSDESLGLRDELDFEAERESGEEDGEEGEEGEEGEAPKKKREIENREEGELSDEEDDDSLLRQEPKTVCRFFNKGQCTWGTNCRFLHPGVSDKGNYNMFAPSKPQANTDKEEETTERERPREVRRFIPEPSPFESAWERGLRYAKEVKILQRSNRIMMKRANKRKETDADFEEKRFNLSLGQAELDRENDYYTRPASPVYKQPDEITDQYLDPYEKQAIRHFRGGHFENFEVRYHVDPRYSIREGGHDRSRREKYEREVSERTSRRSRHAPPGEENRYVRSRIWQDDRYMEVLSTGGGTRGEAEAWADPWARRKTPPRSSRKKKTSRTRSYSTGSSSHSSSRTSRSSSYSSRSRSRSESRTSRSSMGSRSSRSRSSTHSPSPGRRRGNHHKSGIRSLSMKGRPPPPTGSHTRPPIPRRPVEPRDPRMLNIPRRPESKSSKMDSKDRMLNIPRRPEPKSSKMDAVERILNIPRRPETKGNKMDAKERIVPPPIDVKPPKVPLRERLDKFGRIRRETSPHRSRSRSRSRSRGRLGRTFSSSRSRSRSGSRSSSASTRSRSRSRSHSRSRGHSVSRSRSRSSSSQSSSASSVGSRRRVGVKRRVTQGTVSYGQAKSKAMDPMKLSGQKQQIKLTLKGPAVRRLDKPVLPQEDDSGESDTGVKIGKRKPESPPPEPPPVKIVARSPPPAAPVAPQVKKPQANRREELLKQLRAVEDAIARKRTKLPT